MLRYQNIYSIVIYFHIFILCFDVFIDTRNQYNIYFLFIGKLLHAKVKLFHYFYLLYPYSFNFITISTRLICAVSYRCRKYSYIMSITYLLPRVLDKWCASYTIIWVFGFHDISTLKRKWKKYIFINFVGRRTEKIQ